MRSDAADGRSQVMVAAEDIARYACAGSGSGNMTLRVETQEDPRSVTVIFMDHGISYNPLEAPEPEVPVDREADEVSGLGLFLVRRLMDTVTCEYVSGTNILRITKHF